MDNKRWCTRLSAAVAVWTLLALSLACSGEDGLDENHGVAVDGVDEFGKPTLDSTGWEEPPGKADAIQGRPGLPISVDDSSTAVWDVENAWSDRDTDAARKAGLAWEENSGLSWEEKFHLWVDSMPRVERDGYGETFLLTTPYGTELAAPSLECAEVTIFLRVAFASWHGLPYFMEARDANGKRLYFGHFGIRTADGRYGRMANFRDAYDDLSHLADAIADGAQDWPTDSELASRQLSGAQDDQQPMIGDDAHTGAYLDQVFLNKRVGYFLLMHLTYFGSINLADSVNTYHVAAESLRPGDTLLHRWQRTGIGHVMVVMNVDSLGDGDELQLEANVASGSMPRRQPLWENPASTKGQFTNERAGGPAYVDYNGGLKRWRSAAEVGGRWTNIVPDEFGDEYLSASSKSRLAERPERFQELLTELEDEERLGAALDSVEQAREHLRLYPASCVARDNRENSFEDLYEIGEEMGMTRAEIDRDYRELEDYIFAPLVYGESKTCCWNSSTSAMHQLVVDYNIDRLATGGDSQCLAPIVFKGRDDGGDGYERFRQYAVDNGKGQLWVDWSPDENCPQAQGWVADIEQDHDWTPWCDIDFGTEVSTHSFHNDETLAIPDNDPEGVTSTIDVDIEAIVEHVALDLSISHTYNGDLEVHLEKDGVSVEVYNGNGPGDDVILVDEAIDGFQGLPSQGTWTLEVIDTMEYDEGHLEEWSLHLEVR